MDDDDLEVLDCSATPEPSEQTSNTAIDLVMNNTNDVNTASSVFNVFIIFYQGMSPASVLGSRRPSIDGMSSTCTSQSEVRSFKDRLREHVNQVKVYNLISITYKSLLYNSFHFH